ncbi:unnamed protein product [Thelazia callipaeda]|uniref:BSD domain-containing protein n=1 Tax=Thelazia callipaeda TaxID=103827 RepID=A0A0N5CXR2_THECL|nr:unnamed protein product [Thelazia callipaeda]
MDKSESCAGDKAISNDEQSCDADKEEACKSTEDSVQGWVASGTNWGSSWLKTAKEKTYTTLELVKKDLTELSDVVANEASAFASSTVESVKQQAHHLQQIISFEEEHEQQSVEEEEDKTRNEPSEVKQSSSTHNISWTPKLPSVPAITENSWVKTIVDTVKNIALDNTTKDEELFEEIIYPEVNIAKSTNLPHHVLYSIQTDRDTYENQPEGDGELFNMWCKNFDLNAYDEEISTLLANCPPMRALYQELVPDLIENATFWKRYFYKVHQTELLVNLQAYAEKQLLEDDRSKASKNQKEAAAADTKSLTHILLLLNEKA